MGQTLPQLDIGLSSVPLAGWLGRYRRLSRDFEHTVASSEAFVYFARVRRMLKLAA